MIRILNCFSKKNGLKTNLTALNNYIEVRLYSGLADKSFPVFVKEIR